MFLSKMSLSWKIAVPAMVVFLFTVAIAALTLNATRNSMRQERLDSYKHIAQSAKAIADYYVAKEKAGELSREEAQAQAKVAINAIRFDGGGYVFGYKWDGTNIILPFKPSLVGKSLIHLKDKNDVYFVRDLIENAKNAGGEVIYLWPKKDKNGNVIGDFTKYSWSEGVPEWQWMLGTGGYVTDLDDAFYSVAMMVVIMGLIGMVTAALVAFLVIRSINRPIADLIGTMTELAKGNSQIKINGTERADEVGNMAKAIKVFVDTENDRKNLVEEQQAQQQRALARGEAVQAICATFDENVTEMLTVVTGSAQNLQDASGDMNVTAQNTSAQSIQVASASQQASNNVEAVASAAEELAASVAEVSRQVETSNEITTHASSEATSTNARVEKLAQSARQISDVVKLIQDIAEQTNLLALNATIEAARAGEAGKGFAVVASEVKELATQTSKATEEIDKQISEIQSETNHAVNAISSISETIENLSGISAQIATSVDQQRAATTEIASNITEASRVTREVSTHIGEVTEAAQATGETAGMVNASSVQLQAKADDLRKQVNAFLADVKERSAAHKRAS
ncbi:MAG: methyl-accepting chemotaxis protein [Cohaesibacter sp.]|jgi:methyl-accepting chemotaxis protein|nr:methyl-accepting chemotaxis protein [Cohaesibacter sp.]